MLKRSGLGIDSNYRPDIDGLRTIAVLSVIIFHIWPKVLPGGFVGVDIFFVISGYIITGLIIKQIDEGKFSLLTFYGRRIKRIMPMCWLIISLCYLCAWVALLPNDFINFSGSTRAAAFYLTNFYFIKNNNYFALNSNELPLLHFWSLAVEEQFYLFYPLLLVIIYKIFKQRIKMLVMFLLVIFIASLISSIYCGIKGYDNFGYFSIVTRAFELALGALVFNLNQVICRNKFRINIQLMSNIFGYVGAAAILIAVSLINDKIIFPSYIALLPVLGAGLIILAGSVNEENIFTQFLSKRFMVSIGLISYSLYLWHWPILAFWHYENPLLTPNLFSGLIIILFTFILSILSFTFLESPVRKSKINIYYTFVFLQIIPLVIVCVVRQYTMRTNGFENRLMKPSNQVVSNHKVIFNSSNYLVGGDIAKKPPKIVLVGDSHATQYKPFWNYLAVKWGFSIVFMDHKGCHALINRANDSSIEDSTADPVCKKLIQDFTNDYKNFDVIVMAGRWGPDLGDINSILPGQKLNAINGMTYESDYDRTIRELVIHNKKIIIMGDSPNDSLSGVNTYLRHEFLERFSFFSSISDKNAVQFSFYDNHKSNQIMEQFATKYKNVYFFDFNKEVLANIHTFPLINGQLMYADFNHLSMQFTGELAESFVHQDSSNNLKKVLIDYGVITDHSVRINVK